jgi:hypothetical protein
MEFRISMTPDIEDMVKRLGEDVEAGLVAGMTRAVGALEAEVVGEAPVVTSNLANSVTSEVDPDGRRGEVRVQAGYGIYVHEGTGLYGPEKKKITPRTAKALKTPYGPRKSVKGQKPNPFAQRALEATDIQAEFARGLGDYLKSKGW